MRYITDTVYTLQPTTILEPIPENFYDFVQLMTQRGVKFTFEQFWKDDEELIQCRRDDGEVGYYSVKEQKFYSLEELLKDMHKDYDYESLFKQEYNNCYYINIGDLNGKEN